MLADQQTGTAGTTVTTEKISFEEYLKQYEGELNTEWLGGYVAKYMGNNLRHQDLILFLGVLLAAYLRRFPIGRLVMSGLPMYVGEDRSAREPDVMLILNEHLDRLEQTHVKGVGDIVIEIVSPESTVRDRGTKFTEYEKNGVPEYWIIDPQHKEAVIYALDPDGVYLRVPEDEYGKLRSSLLSSFMLSSDILWQETLPDPVETIALVEKMGQV